MSQIAKCIVCYDTSPIAIACEGCNTKVCLGCFESYLSVCEEQTNNPCCVNCKGMYNVQRTSFSKETINHFCCIFIKYHLAKETPGFEKKMNEENMILHLRNEKKKFMLERLPKALSRLAEIALPDKLRKISKPSKEESKLGESIKKRCFNTFCNGILIVHSSSGDFHCMKCNFTFCVKCEEKKDDGNHTCNENTLQSLKYLKDNESFRHCPKCSIPIFKYAGCDHMTCANCKCNFSFSKGELSSQGSHNNEISYQQDKVYSLSQMIAENKVLTDHKKDTIILKIVKFEEKQPRYIPQSEISNILKGIVNQKVAIEEVAYKFTTMMYKVVGTQKKLEKFMKTKHSLYRLVQNVDKVVNEKEVEREVKEWIEE